MGFRGSGFRDLSRPRLLRLGEVSDVGGGMFISSGSWALVADCIDGCFEHCSVGLC